MTLPNIPTQRLSAEQSFEPYHLFVANEPLLRGRRTEERILRALAPLRGDFARERGQWIEPIFMTHVQHTMLQRAAEKHGIPATLAQSLHDTEVHALYTDIVRIAKLSQHVIRGVILFPHEHNRGEPCIGELVEEVVVDYCKYPLGDQLDSRFSVFYPTSNDTVKQFEQRRDDLKGTDVGNVVTEWPCQQVRLDSPCVPPQPQPA